MKWGVKLHKPQAPPAAEQIENEPNARSGATSGRSARLGRAALLGMVVLAPEVAAWQGLLGLARDTFHLQDPMAYLVPLLFGAPAFYVALLAQRYVMQGDSATTERLLTWVYASAGAGFNLWHARMDPASALFFSGASLSAALLWDRTLRAWLRDQLREVGAIEAPLPRFRALRWLLAPIATFTAFRVAVLEGLTTPTAALAVATERAAARRAARTDSTASAEAAQPDPAPEHDHTAALTTGAVPATQNRTQPEPGDVTTTERHGIRIVPPAVAEPAIRNKSAAVRSHLTALGVNLSTEDPTLEQVHAVIAQVAEAGAEVDVNLVRTVCKRERERAERERTSAVQIAPEGVSA